MTFKQMHSSCVTAHRRLGKLSSLEEGKASIESVLSGLYLAASVLLLRRQTCRPALRASIAESGPCVCLHSASVANTFFGQHSPAHGEGDCRNASEGAGCHAGFTWPRVPVTSHGPLARSGRPACQMPKWGAKLALEEGSKEQWEALACMIPRPEGYHSRHCGNVTPGPGSRGCYTEYCRHVTPGAGSGRWGHPGDCGRVTPITRSKR